MNTLKLRKLINIILLTGVFFLLFEIFILFAFKESSWIMKNLGGTFLAINIYTQLPIILIGLVNYEGFKPLLKLLYVIYFIVIIGLYLIFFMTNDFVRNFDIH